MNQQRHRDVAMDYHLDCECGYYVIVEEAAAGTTVECRCGRGIEVPSLRQLRQLRGLAAPEVPPEQVIETLLLAKKLPEEHHCLLCAVPTEATVFCQTECERVRVGQETTWWKYLLAIFTLGWMGVAVIERSSGGGQEFGKDRIFSLPLRVCDICRKQLTSREKIMSTLVRVPVYSTLLKKYPRAVVFLRQT